jgi:glycosyltransferase involved in cell wall biosynthesis
MAQQSIAGFNSRSKTVRMKQRRPSISVVYPMFNEEENIERAVCFAEAALANMTSDYEILIVNDASTDRSAEVVEALARANPSVKVFHHERNLKLGGALRTGFSNATKELVFYCDSDLPVDLMELNRAARIMEFTRSDIVSAFRFDRTAEGPLRTLYSVVYNLLIRFLFPLRVKDINFSFKLFKREVLDKVALESQGSFIDAELLIKSKLHGFKIVQFGVDYFPRNRGVSTLSSPEVIFKMLRELVRFRMKMRQETRTARSSRLETADR